MTALEGFIEKMKHKYGGEVELNGRASDSAIPDVPAPLRELYALYESVAFPFGEIFRAEDNDEQQRYFKERGWFCFGFDFYFSYWLCSYEPDGEGMWLTSWDHDSESDIEAVYSDLTEFLSAMEKEYR